MSFLTPGPHVRFSIILLDDSAKEAVMLLHPRLYEGDFPELGSYKVDHYNGEGRIINFVCQLSGHDS